MRDDLNKLPLPAQAKSYARRKGLKTLGPAGWKAYATVNAMLLNKGLKNVFKSRDVGVKESGSREIINGLFESLN